MEWNKQTIKSLLLVVCGGVAFFCALQNLSIVFAAIGAILGMMTPFLLGGAIAFVLNVPMRAIERHLFPNSSKGAKVRRPLALILALVAVLSVLSLATGVIAPGVVDAVMSIINQIPKAIQRLQNQLQELEEYLPMLENYVVELDVDWRSVSERAVNMLQNWGSGLISTGSGLIGGVVSGVSTFLISFIFGIYILIQKEKLARQGRQVCYALLPMTWADRVLEVLRLANRTFSSFLSGQCLEAVILGMMFVVSMSIFGMPYALLIGVLIAVTALIPIVGAFIGCAVGALLIALVNPWQALMFILLFFVLQQVEGNLIYPHVVGSSVGLPSIWVLAAVTLGGKLMGIGGMLLFIPLCSVLYALFREHVKKRLVKKNIPAEKWREAPPEGK